MLFRRNRKAHPEAEKALRESKQVLARVQARTTEVHKVSEESVRFRRENHFADSLQQLFQPPGGKTS